MEEVICREKHPRTKITLAFEILSSDSCLLAHLLNLANYTLMQAGVSIFDTLSAVVCSLDNSGQFLVDPTDLEKKDAVFSLNLAVMTNSNKISYFKTEGKMDFEDDKLNDVSYSELTLRA